MATCYQCENSLEAYLLSKVSRQDSCTKCHRDIRCCKNCEFYDLNVHWACHEEVPEHIVDKEKANFCDFFKLRAKGAPAGGAKTKNDLLSAAEALFKK